MLPIEILSLVMRHLADDKKSLYNSAQVNWAFYHASMRYLWRYRSFSRQQVLEEYLSEAQHAFRYIRDISFYKRIPWDTILKTLECSDRVQTVRFSRTFKKDDVTHVRQCIEACPTFQKITFFGCLFAVNIVEFLQDVLWNLDKTLDIAIVVSDVRPLTEPSAMIKQTPLRSLDIKGVSSFDNLMMNGLRGGFDTLQSLSISKAPITEGCIMKLAPSLRHLRKISFLGVNIGDYGLEALANNCKSLQDVCLGTRISPCYNPSKNGVVLLAQSCRNLQRLYINGVKMDDMSVLAVLTLCAITHLDIGKSLITQDLFKTMNERFLGNSVKELVVDSCPNLQLEKEAGKQTKLYPLTQYIVRNRELCSFDCSNLDNISRAFIYGFRMIREQDLMDWRSVNTKQNIIRGECILTPQSISRLRAYVNNVYKSQIN